MTPTSQRIGVLGVVFATAFAAVVLHLWFLMVQDHETWARRSHENRWAFKSVPSQRGTLRDRFGRVLAHDEPTTQLAVHYLRYRLRHPVGAAVHGASLWAQQQPDRAGTTYDHLDGALGPDAAARDLLAMPVRQLRPRVLPNNVARELATAVTTVLASCSEQPRRRVFAALRRAAQDGSTVAVGDVLAVPREQLLAAFATSWRRLLELDRVVLLERERHLGRPLGPDDEPGLVGTLERLRLASLADERVKWFEDGEWHLGSKKEEVRAVFAEHVPFDVAAELRVSGDHYAGIDVLPSVTRRCTVDVGSALHALLGSVVTIDRTVPPKDAVPPENDEPEAWAEYRRLLADQQAFERFLAREMPEDWIDELEPPDDDATAADRTSLQADARDRYTRELLLQGRRGLSGFEAAFDDEMMGRLGLRLVAHDAKRREQMLWNHLRVEAGEDVQLTIDLDLQRVAEAATAAGRQRQLHGDEQDHARTEAALAVIDARTGDVLAYAGAPIWSPQARNVPGIVWQGNGALGSVVKPFVLVEQLQSEAMGRPHRPLATLDGCDNDFRYGGRVLHCSHAHWDGGRDAIEALAESCNEFFFQCAVGLGDEGVARALRRFGLAKPPEGDAFTACWQGRVRGIPAAPPSHDRENTLLPQQAVGYGVQASPLHVARAYAAVATGSLPTLGLQPGARPHVPMDDVVGELAFVEKGLRACVQHGTARKLELLNELQACGKTGTAEVSNDGKNNAWFAGYLPPLGSAGTQLCFCAVVYWVQDRTHGGDAAGRMVTDFLAAVQADAGLRARYLLPEGGR